MILGHQKIWSFLQKSFDINKFSHAYLFSGQEKLGKKTLALGFAEELFKTGKLRESLNFIFIEPTKKEIQISQIRELIGRLSFKSSTSLFKIAIIDQAHCLNQESQSALLKILEEPKGKTIIFLITEYPELLFPTILSRLQKIKFYPVNKKDIANYLKSQNIAQDKIQEILQVSQGRPGVAMDLIRDPQKLKEINEKKMELKKIICSPLVFRFKYVKDTLQKECDLRELMEVWLFYFRHGLISFVKSKTQKEAQEQNGEFQFFLKNNYSLGKLKNILQQIQYINFLLSKTNINPRLALEKLVVEF